MSTLAFTGDMARLQQAIAEAHDLVVDLGPRTGGIGASSSLPRLPAKVS